MRGMDDMALLREYAARQSETAFTTLVERHIGLVYCAALRQVRDPAQAQEITQGVFGWAWPPACPRTPRSKEPPPPPQPQPSSKQP